MKMIVSILELCILGSVSSMNYQSAFRSLNFYFQLNNFVHKKENIIF